ncbi:hypothetical protein LJC04_02635 [Ruminococcaceae bacterium OttesenSCG-928-O06]|nr:hypothetical protein [Ruminococcaceae bacterium OttesenSCG-928-O06]
MKIDVREFGHVPRLPKFLQDYLKKRHKKFGRVAELIEHAGDIAPLALWQY